MAGKEDVSPSGGVTRRRLVGAAAVACIVMLASCGTSDVGTDGAVLGDQGPSGVTATVELGYPRDLFERGLVNVVLSNDSIDELVVHVRELAVDGFWSAGAQRRRSTLPGGGSRVALQTRFGEVQCEDPRPPTASMLITYSTSADPTQRRAAIPIVDTSVLADIQARMCTAEHVRDALDIRVEGVSIDRERIEAELVLTRVAGSSTYSITRTVGTVLIGAEVRGTAGAGPWAMPADATRLVLPLEFSVNRCDAHAVAETTRRFGLDLRISVDGAPEQAVPLPLGDLASAFEAILERCQARTAPPVSNEG